MPGPAADLLAACGATVGSPESAGELMRHDQTILVFPGGGRELAKFKGEEYSLRWQGRTGFARIAAEHDYPIVPAGLIGGDDVYRSLTTRDGRWGRLSQALAKALGAPDDMAMPLLHGIGPTLIPRPQRMYLRFAEPIDTIRPTGVSAPDWADTVKHRTQTALEAVLADLQEIRAGDPYRELNPLAWRDAARP
jgi:1-acyl-sn-glycerol-3-phosphate acyltransferase